MTTIAEALKIARKPWVLVQADFQGLLKRWAVKNLSVPYSAGDPLFFEGRLLAEPAIGTSFSLESMTCSLRSLEMTIANDGRLQDEEVRRRLDGAKVTVYLWADGLDWADIATNGVLFRGYFAKKSHDAKRYAFTVTESPLIEFGAIPRTTINAATWPSHRTEGGAGSVAGLPQAIVYGDWPRGVPLKCIDTSAYKYLAMAGESDSTDADYTATTVNVYDKDGAVVAAGGFTFYPAGRDGNGGAVSYFDFTADKVASEPLSASIRGIPDSSGFYTGTTDALIEHPAHIVHHLIATETKTAHDRIDVQSLKTMAARLPGVKFATIINKATDAIAVVDRILGQCAYARTQARGAAAVFGIHPDAPVVYRSGRSSQAGDVVMISRTPDSKVVNDLSVKYGLNPSTGAYESEMAFDYTNDSLCRLSVYQYGTRPRVTLSYPDVQDEGTARVLAQRYLSLFAFRHDIVERSEPAFRCIDIVEGDAAELDVLEGPSVDGAGWVAEKFILIERAITGAVINQKWWRVAT